MQQGRRPSCECNGIHRKSAAHYADLSGVCTVSLAASGALQDLCSFVFRNHALELNQELILRAAALRRLHEQGFDSLAGQLFDQQNLVSILSAQSVGRVREHNLDLSFGGEIAHRSNPGRSNVAPL